MIIQDKSILKQKSSSVDLITSEAIIGELKVEFANHKAIGLSAIQIGKPVRVFILKCLNGTIKGFLNPKISKFDTPRVIGESCLSFPGVSVMTKRATYIEASDDINGSYVMENMEAVAYQHELDHLDGLTIYDRKYESPKVGRNDSCPCGSGRKYKRCCGK